MLTPALRHKQKTLAAKAALVNGDSNRTKEGASQYQLMLYALAQDKIDLKNIASIEKKAELKAERLPNYMPWIEGVLAGGTGVKDDVLTTMMVWSIDIGDFDYALDIAEYCVKHALEMPDQYNRTLTQVITEEIVDESLKAHKANKPMDSTSLDRLCDLIGVDSEAGIVDMHDQVQAKLFKALGYAKLQNETLDKDALEVVLTTLNRALELDKNSGVIKDIERVKREIKNIPAA